MSLSATSLIQDLGQMSSKLAKQKENLAPLEADVKSTSELRNKIIRELKANNKLDWDHEEGRALLDQLYKQDAFLSFEKVYRFNKTEDALPFLQELDAYYREKFDQLKFEKDLIRQKQSNLEQYQQEILRIINQLSQSMSTVNR